MTCSPSLSLALLLQVKQVDSTVEAGAQFQQMVNVECVNDFTEQPDMNISFYYHGNPTTITCKLPISINKFIEPTEMTSEVRLIVFITNKVMMSHFLRCSSLAGRTSVYPARSVRKYLKLEEEWRITTLSRPS